MQHSQLRVTCFISRAEAVHTERKPHYQQIRAFSQDHGDSFDDFTVSSLLIKVSVKYLSCIPTLPSAYYLGALSILICDCSHSSSVLVKKRVFGGAWMYAHLCACTHNTWPMSLHPPKAAFHSQQDKPTEELRSHCCQTVKGPVQICHSTRAWYSPLVKVTWREDMKVIQHLNLTKKPSNLFTMQ